MLSRKYSIKKQDFYKIYKLCRFVNAYNFVIKTHPNFKKYSQFAVVISKKIIPKAVDRNRTRRIIKSWILKQFDEITKGKFIIITLRKNILESENLDIVKTDLLKCIKSIK